jgi:hypothetical protein
MSVLCFQHKVEKIFCCNKLAKMLIVPQKLCERKRAIEATLAAAAFPENIVVGARQLQELAESYVAVADCLADFMGPSMDEARMEQMLEVVRMMKEAGFGKTGS